MYVLLWGENRLDSNVFFGYNNDDRGKVRWESSVEDVKAKFGKLNFINSFINYSGVGENYETVINNNQTNIVIKRKFKFYNNRLYTKNLQ